MTPSENAIFVLFAKGVCVFHEFDSEMSWGRRQGLPTLQIPPDTKKKPYVLFDMITY